jgi:hypothetical protein
MAKGKTGTSKTVLTVKFHIVMSPRMKEILKETAEVRDISEGHVVREILAREFDLDSTHVRSIEKLRYVKRSKDPEPVSTKRMFPDVRHPLEAAFSRVIIKDEEDEDV